MKTIHTHLTYKTLLRATLTTLFVVFAHLSGFTQTLGVYAFTGTSTGAGQFNAVTSQPSEATFSTFNRNGVDWVAGANLFVSNNFDATINTSKYLAFTITPNVSMALSSISWDQGRAGNAGTYSLRSSLDGYAADIATGTIPASVTNVSVTLPSGFQNLSSAVTFRYYAYNLQSTASTRNVTIDNVTLNGTTCSVSPCWTYCTASGNLNCTLNDYISNVTFNTINRNSTCDAGGYINTGVSTTLTIGATYNLSISTGPGTGNHTAGVWIDWNNNGTFETTEYTLIGTTIAPSSSANVNITVPNDAVVGTTRMRVRYFYSTAMANNLACTSGGTYGETEAYTIVVAAPADCAGTPPAGTISPSTSDITTAGSVNFSWSEAPATGYTYQWQSAPTTGGTWSDIGGATSSTYNATGLSIGTIYFRLKVTCTISGLFNTSATAQVNVTPVYCASTHASTLYYMTNVTFNTINKTSTTCASPYQCDYTATSTTVTAGSSYNLTVTATSGASTAYIYAYFDWNYNGSFLDAGESYLIGTTTAGGSSVVGPVSIAVPSGATLATTRMRMVMSRTDQVVGPCETTSTYGETEGYSVIVQAPANCSGTPPAGTITPATNNITTATNASLSWSEAHATGYTYQWQSAPSTGGPWTNVSGATSSGYTTSGLSAGTIYYRLNVTCTISSLSNTSATAQVNVSLVYCTPSNLNCSAADRIERVQIGTLDNNSGTTCTATTGYSNYSTSVSAPTLLIGTSYNLSVTVGSGSGTHSAGVWFDFNQNGSFLDAGEFFSIAQSTINPSTTTVVAILIPTTASTGNVRMRIQYAFNSVILSSFVCSSPASYTYGETEDYTVNLACGATPSDVTNRFPANALNLPCGSAATLMWRNNVCATGYKVYMDTSPTPTTLVADGTATYYYTGNLASSTTYYWKVVPYSGGGDGASSTWSFNTLTAITTAVSQDTSGCYDAGVCMQASGGGFPDYYWYNTAVNGSPLATGATYCPTGVTTQSTYYVSNVLVGSPTSIATSPTSATTCAGTGYGSYFDVQTKSANVTVTSIDVMFKDVGGGGSANRPVKVYYRTTSYKGYTASSTGWTLIDNLSINVLNTPTTVTNIDITDVFVPAGSVYGFYLVYDQAYLANSGVYSNSDVEIITGTISCGGEFGAGTQYHDRSFRGNVYYKISCSSPTSPVVLTPWISTAQSKLALTSVTNATAQCVESDWTYYADPAAKNDWLFAIKKNGNTFTANVDIVEAASTYSSVNAPVGSGSFLISRYWNVRLTSGSISTPVDVRFLFDTAEVRAAYEARNTERTTNYPSSNEVAWKWFKSVGSDFNPATGINGNTFTFSNVALTADSNYSLLGAAYTGYINNVPYVNFTGVTSFSGGTGGFGFSPAVGSPLPVKLLTFNAKAENTSVKLDWLTETEINNDYFTIEKSRDGITFEVVEVIKGNGTSNNTISYKTIDKTPFKGVSYYRLKQTNYDGSSEYFTPVAVNIKFSFGDVSLHPNPVTGVGNLSLFSIVENEQNVYILDVSGRVVTEHKFEVVKGMNTLLLETFNLSKGMYYIRIGQAEDSVHLKFIKE